MNEKTRETLRAASEALRQKTIIARAVVEGDKVKDLIVNGVSGKGGRPG